MKEDEDMTNKFLSRVEHDKHTLLASTVPTACHRLGIGRTLLYDLLKQEKLKSIKLGRRTLIPESELQRLITEQLMGGQS